MKIVVIAAHPDDEVLGCGGSIIKHSMKGDEVHIRILTDGATTRDSGGLKEKLRENAYTCSEILGATSLKFYDLPNQRLDTIPILEIIETIEEILNEVKPDRIYTHHVGDLNIDHQKVHHATLTAARPLAGSYIEEIYSYFVHSSTEWYQSSSSNVFIPNVFVEISDVIDRKIEAMKSYETECRPFPHLRSPESIRLHSQCWGLDSGLKYAEPFMLIRSLRNSL